MKKIVFVVLGLLAISMFLVGCAKESVELVDEEGNVIGEAMKLTMKRYQVAQPAVTVGAINKNDLFLVTGSFPDGTVGEILEYKGADKAAVTNPMIKFRQWSTGDTIERSVQEGLAEIRLGGKLFKVKLLNPTVIDSPIQVDLNSDWTIDATHEAKNIHFLLNSKGVRELGLCDVQSTLLEGESRVYEVYGKGTYNVLVKSVLYQSYAGGIVSASVKVNNEEFDLVMGESRVLADGKIIALDDILYQDYPGGVHGATFCLR